MRTKMKKLILASLLLSTVLLPTGLAYAAPLYFPHAATSLPWQTEIAIINTSSDQTVTGTLRAFNDEGLLIETKDVTLSARGRRQITVADEFALHTAIRYIIFDTDSDAVQGYMKFYQQGIDRAAIPAVKEVNTSDIYIPIINSSANWWTGLILLNTTSTTKELTITFNTGQIAHYTLNANQHRAFPIESLFNYEPQPSIQSAVITNASGIIGLEVVGDNFGALCGIPFTGNTTSTLYFPYVTAADGWWTGIAAYNPSASACTITITPYDAQGNPFSPQTFYVAGKQTFMGVASALGLPAQTAWLKIDSTQPLTGLELFGNTYLHQIAAYAGVFGTGLKTGVFAEIEKNGWTGIYFVNTEATAASVILTAYNDIGTAVATRVLSVGGHANVVNFPEDIFSQDISSATYIAYSSDRSIVGFQLNSSSDGVMLDGLPVLAGVVTPATGTVTLTSGNVTIPVNASTSSSGPAPPSGFQLASPPTYYDIGTTVNYTPPVTVCIAYDPAPYPDPNPVRLLHYESDIWLDVTTSNDVAGHTICGQVNSLSPFLIAQKTDKPPVITAVSANPAVLWPPNNKMVDVSVNYSATDGWDQPVCQISSVTGNEQLSSSDYALVDAHHIKLRAARLGGGNGRIYTITIGCTDTSGKSSEQAVNVSVPHDQGKK